MEYRILEGGRGSFYPQYRYDKNSKWTYLAGALPSGCIGTIVEATEKAAKEALMRSEKWRGGSESDIRSIKE